MTDHATWIRLRQLAIVVEDIDAVAQDLHYVLGLEVGHADPELSKLGLRHVVIPVGGQFLELMTPIAPGTPAGRYLQRHKGDGGYMVITECNDLELRRKHIERLRIRVVAQYDQPHERFLDTQLHPADTGGSFLEIDQQDGDTDVLGGKWFPAGPTWHRAIRTSLVSGFDAAEMHCQDPARVASRWSEVLDLPVRKQGDAYVIDLVGSTLRFIAIPDGRTETLRGLDLNVVDGKRIRELAKERGVLSADGSYLTIGGMRMYLDRS